CGRPRANERPTAGPGDPRAEQVKNPFDSETMKEVRRAAYPVICGPIASACGIPGGSPNKADASGKAYCGPEAEGGGHVRHQAGRRDRGWIRVRCDLGVFLERPVSDPCRRGRRPGQEAGRAEDAGGTSHRPTWGDWDAG